MNIHKNARLMPLRREEMGLGVIEGPFFKAHAARVYGVSAQIAAVANLKRKTGASRDGISGVNRRPPHHQTSELRTGAPILPR